MAKKTVKIENPIQAITTAFVQIVDAFRVKRNPLNGKELISNIPTQLVGNMTRSFVAVWTKEDGQKRVELSEFQPARNLETGEKRKDLAGKYFSSMRYGTVGQGAKNRKAIVEREFWYTLSYFAASICKGKIPTPDKRSGSSTIMSHFVKHWMDSQGLSLESLKIVESSGAELTYTGVQFDRMLGIFHDNGIDILENWDNSVKGQKGEAIDWV